MKFFKLASVLCGIILCNLSCNLEVIEDFASSVPVTASYSVDCYKVSFQFTSELQATQTTWNFGDGSSSNEPSPVHKFLPGSHQVNLLITDGQLQGDTSFTIQIPYATYIERFGTVLDDAKGVGIIENEEGNFIALGTSFDTYYGLEVSPCGEELKFSALGMEDNIAPGEMIRLSNGNYALTGFNSSGSNGFIFLVDESLNLATVKNFPAPSGESTFYSDIIETSSNELIISGSKFGNGFWGLVLHKSNLSAQAILGPRIYTSNEIGAGPIIESSSGGFIMIFKSVVSGLSSISYATLNNSFENPQSVVIKSRPSSSDQFTVVDSELVEDNNIMIFGTVRNIGANTIKPYIFKIKNGGDELFFKVVESAEFVNTIDFGLSIKFEIMSDGYLFGGINNNETNIYLFKTNLAGQVQWDRVYSINGGSALRDILVASDGGFVLIGEEDGALDEEIIIIKTDNNGNI